ncbi:MAG TPA: hypothetical protein VF669_11920 [Tepidisphaeraceae bacterium]|jgi:hypothetical protein
MRKKSPLVPAFGVLLLVAGAYAAYLYWPARLPPLDSKPGDLVQFIATDRFKKLSDSERDAYVNSVRPHVMALYFDQTIPEEVKETAYMNAVMPRMNARMDEYFKLPPGAARDAYVDQMIAKRKAATKPTSQPFWARMAAGRPPSNAGTGGSSGANALTPARMKRFVENAPPTRRAQMAEFFSDIARREKGR